MIAQRINCAITLGVGDVILVLSHCGTGCQRSRCPPRSGEYRGDGIAAADQGRSSRTASTPRLAAGWQRVHTVADAKAGRGPRDPRDPIFATSGSLAADGSGRTGTCAFIRPERRRATLPINGDQAPQTGAAAVPLAWSGLSSSRRRGGSASRMSRCSSPSKSRTGVGNRVRRSAACR